MFACFATFKIECNLNLIDRFINKRKIVYYNKLFYIGILYRLFYY